MRSLFVVLFCLMFFPFVLSLECGDFICEVDENITCPSDCDGEDAENDQSGTLIINEEDMLNESFDVITVSDEAGDSSSSMFKIIAILLVLVVLSVIVFFIYRKAKEDGNVSVNLASEESL